MAQSYDELQLDFTCFRAGDGEGGEYRAELSERESRRTAGCWPTADTGTALYREQLLREAGEEVADKILKKLNTIAPPTK